MRCMEFWLLLNTSDWLKKNGKIQLGSAKFNQKKSFICPHVIDIRSIQTRKTELGSIPHGIMVAELRTTLKSFDSILM